MKLKYSKAEANVDKIVDALKGHQMRLMKDSAILDKMYAQNLTYFKNTRSSVCTFWRERKNWPRPGRDS